MIPDQVTAARYDEVYYKPPGDWFPVLVVTIDGVEYQIEREQKLIEKYGIVTFSELHGADYGKAEQYTLVWELEVTPGSMVRRMEHGATNDPRIVNLANRFKYDYENDRFRPGQKLEIQ